ncbi:MAG: ABC transporter ATP-binding protein [Chloroflexi bacterium]|nr:ABC transporter ATP-binding protein [Chloroflexota bacterium]
MEKAIRVEGLTKRYGAFTAVDNVTFSVKSGEIFGILGPNGAGKTTTLEIIEGLQDASDGYVSVLGLDIRRKASQVKSRIGVQLQASAYYDYLNLREILSLIGSFYPRQIPANRLLEQVGLQDQATQRVRQLSGGQQQRFSIAASLVNDPELLILDEPTTGLDPQARRNTWALIREINQKDVTVVLTTHYMEEAEALCHRLAIMDQGRLVATDTPQNLINGLKATYTVSLTPTEPLTEDQLLSLNGAVSSVQLQEGNTYLIRLSDSPGALDKVLEGIVHNGVRLERLNIEPVTLEDVFLELTGNELRD